MHRDLRPEYGGRGLRALALRGDAVRRRNYPEIPDGSNHFAGGGNMVYRPLRRPWFGWGAREWRRKALNGPIAAFWVVGSAAICNLLLEIVRLFASWF